MAKPIDRQNVDRLVERHLPEALRFATRLTGSAEVGEEVVQEALCRVLARWKSFRGESAFGTWMLQIVLNVARQRRRDDKHVDHLDAEPIGREPTPQTNLAAEELTSRIARAIDELPSRQREIAILRFGDERSVREVAEILNISEANVHSTVHLIRGRIAKAIDFNYAKK